MTEPATPPPVFRVIGSPNDASEMFIPMSTTARSRAVLQRLLDSPSNQERQAMAQEQSAREAERLTNMARRRVRHAVLLQAHYGHPVVRALLDAHRPHLTESSDGRPYAECHGCPSYWENDGYGETGEIHHEWPCPTWATISEQTP